MNDSIISDVVERLRSVVGRDLGQSFDALARVLELDPSRFRRLVENPEASADSGFAIDVIAAFVYEFATDPEWLVTGKYDSSIHRQALVLREDRSRIGRLALRDFVQQRYARTREQATETPTPSGKGNQ